MGKRGKNQKKGPNNPKKMKLHEDVDLHDMDDEIDAFHKKRDMIPLDIKDDDRESDDDDDQQPVFDYEGIEGDDDDDDEGDDDDEVDEDDDEDEDDDGNLKGLTAKIVRQQKFLKAKYGGVDDEMHDDFEEAEKKGTVWSRKKNSYYGSETKNYELELSDEDTPVEEEEEVIKLQKERAESLRDEDFGLQVDEQDDNDEEPTLEEMMVKGKTTSKSSGNKELEDDATPMYEVKKDLSALSRDEQMDAIYTSAPELVGLLTELNDAVKQLETQVNPLLTKVVKGDKAKKEGMHYLEVKQLLLRSYCQAITFYLLLKSEGLPVRDHPVIARLVDIKSLLDKMKELDGHLPNGLDDALIETTDIAAAKESAVKHPAFSSDLFTANNNLSGFLAEKNEISKFKEAAEPPKMQSSEVIEKKRQRDRGQYQPVSLESAKMLQHRAALEEKLKHKGVSASAATETDKSKRQKMKTPTGQLETMDDFDDDSMDLEQNTRANGHSSALSSKLSKFITAKDKLPKGGDDDLPERDDLGERRWKHELRVLAGAGIKLNDDDVHPENGPRSFGVQEADVDGTDETDGSEDEFYKQIKHQRAAKLAMKADKYSRNSQIGLEPETTIDGKRHISTQIEKNRGLTRNRKKLTKNPRKKYKLKYVDAVNRRKGQVREIKKPSGPYGGETTGINARISRSVRFN